ncbi:MAG: hypothetical protein DBW95_02355 [Gammaproteobacteria bacterium]|nr:MAG: hypothetical protein DBW95_02355 [Gammaproteobacteria bacterium]|tara:strand:+ start:1809 stop:2678 length:870 start_codon:yes stop_codon:yes gene_type:complete
MIYISTGGIKNKTATSAALEFHESGINKIELSGGIYSKNFRREIKELPKTLDIQIHNYYPPAKVPFVFNLASKDEEISSLSINHVKKSIDLCSKIGSKIFAFHAGFRLDPKVNELGKKINKNSLISREEATDLFLKRVKFLHEEAKKINVQLMIENNVISKKNIEHFQDDPLLFTNPKEIKEIMSMLPSDIGFLLDVAHLKVSSNSLGFDLEEGHKNLFQEISAYHLSENNGLSDQNKSLKETSWFWKDLKTKVKFFTLEIYNTSVEELKIQKSLVENSIENINQSKRK